MIPTRWLGRAPYLQTWALQKKLRKSCQQGVHQGAVLYLEHPHTITVGRRAAGFDSLLHSRDQLEEMGYGVLHIERGGDATYHGPGQLVVYPVLNIVALGLDVRTWVRALEQAGVDFLAEVGIRAARWPGRVGVWVGVEGAQPSPRGGPAKVMALGVHISSGVSLHGVALNLSTALDRFAAIVPCGLRDGTVTSVKELLGEAPGLETAARSHSKHLERVLGCKLDWSPKESLDFAFSLGAASSIDGKVGSH